MDSDIKISKLNQSYLIAETEDEGMQKTLYEMFTYHKPKFFYSPKFKSGVWDGKIHMYESDTGKLPIGLFNKLKEHLNAMNISYKVTDDRLNNLNKGISEKEIEKYMAGIIPPSDIKTYEHQKDLLKVALYLKKVVAVCPTGSGKSFAYYLYIKFLMEKFQPGEKGKILLVVPTISLVLQMRNEFLHYDENYNLIKNQIHTIMAGDDKDSDKRIYISTWQSIYGLDVDYFGKFKVLIMDEFHQYGKAECLIGIGSKCINAGWRLGATGTIDEWPVHHLVMNGLVGDIYQITKTKTLIDKGILSPLKIYPYIFKYPKEECELLGRVMMAQGDKKRAYFKEIEYIYSHRKRNNAVVNMVSMLKGNTFVMFTRKKHGRWLFEQLAKKLNGVNKVFYVDGGTSAQERIDIQAQFERDCNCTGVVCDQVFGVGVNVKNLNNIVSAGGRKGKIKVLQKIGRGLRKHILKLRLIVIDIVDDLSFIYINEKTGRKNKFENYGLLHHAVRLKYYEQEQFPYEVKTVSMEGKNG